MKKFLALLLTTAMVTAITVSGGTIAYLQSEASDVNVMTTGNVSIEQHEYERVVDNNEWVEASEYKATFGGDTYTPDKMKEFTQNKPAYPAVYQDGDVKWDDRNGSQNSSGEGSHQQSWLQVGAPGSNQLFDDSVKNVIDKFVFVENTGISDAYYRTLIAVESPEENTAKIHYNFNSNSRFDAISGSGSEKSYFVDYITVDGIRYELYNMTYNQVLTPDEVSRPSLLQMFLDPTATNEDCAAFGDTWEVLVLSQAVQSAGFADAATALNTAFGDVEENAANWFKNLSDPDETTDDYNVVEVTAADLATLDFTQDNARFVLSGEFTDDIFINVSEGLNQVYDAGGASFAEGTTVTINAPGVAHAYSSLKAERSGNVTVTGFTVGTLNVLAYNNEKVTISENTTNSMSIIGGNFELIIDGNTIDGNFGTYTDGENQSNDYGISMRITDYELSMTNNTITDTYSHAIGINGRQGEASSDWGACGVNNKIAAFSGNNITVNSTQKTGRAALKIWCDCVYAPYATSGQEPNAAAKGLMDSILGDTTNVFTLGEGHTTFNIFDYKQ